MGFLNIKTLLFVALVSLTEKKKALKHQTTIKIQPLPLLDCNLRT